MGYHGMGSGMFFFGWIIYVLVLILLELKGSGTFNLSENKLPFARLIFMAGAMGRSWNLFELRCRIKPYGKE